MNPSTIAAVATPPGTGAIALLRVSGPEAAAVVGRVFRGGRTFPQQPRYQQYGRIADASGEIVDEGLFTYFPGPASFTGEDLVEIACHGGVLVTRRVLEALLAAGAAPAAPGEFSQRAFCNGRLDLTQAEAIMDLISARSDLAMKAAGEQLSGRLGRAVESIRLDLIALLAHLEAYIDFPEEDIAPDTAGALLQRLDAVRDRLDSLLSTAEQGRILREGVRTVICGAPNAGKSSLLNVLLGFDRAIVSETAGTTRDTIEEGIHVKGIPLRLIDTAGLRVGEGEIEAEGIARSRAQIAGAELILEVIDASAPAVGVEAVVAPEGTRHLRLLNKMDLPRHPDWSETAGLSVSCLDEESIAALRERIFEMVAAGTGLASADLISINARHQHCLGRARAELETARAVLAAGESPEFVAADLRAALDAVGEVVGRTDIEEILGEIFSTFCIGK